MKLYRNLSCTELLSLLEEGKVKGRFSYENCHSGYKKEFGPVVCCFKEPICFGPPAPYDFIIELEVEESDIIEEGRMEWEQDDGYEYFRWQAPEVYIRCYTRDQVKGIWDLGQFFLHRAFYVCDDVFSLRWPTGCGWFPPEERKNYFGEPWKDREWFPKAADEYVHYLDRVDEEWILKKNLNRREKATLLLLKKHLDFLRSIPPAEGENFMSNRDSKFLVETFLLEDF